MKWTAVHLGELSDAQRASGEPWLEFPIIYVAAHQPHRFTKIIEELRVLVFLPRRSRKGPGWVLRRKRK